MANINTTIEWTDATWSPVTGCTKVSQGCKNCYAERLAPKVFAHQRVFEQPGTVNLRTRPRVFTDVKCHPERLDAPLHWKKPRRVFVNSMSDLFHEDVPFEFIDQVFRVMASAARHSFQILTKRAGRMRDYCASNAVRALTLPNVWLGVSVEDQATADERIPLLLQTPAAVRFLSCEPLLGPIDTWRIAYGNGLYVNVLLEQDDDIVTQPRIDWVIAGGESGPNARPMHPDWARALRDQCAAAGVPYFFKQWGEWAPVGAPNDVKEAELRVDTPEGKARPRLMFFPLNDYCHEKIGKKAAGRLLDGRTHDEYPA